jgi:DNA mismatch repair protein MSH3
VILTAFNKIANAFDPVDTPLDVGFKSRVLNEILSSLPRLRGSMGELLAIISLKKAAEGRKDTMWNDPERHPAIADIDMVCICELFLEDELLITGFKGHTSHRSRTCR